MRRGGSNPLPPCGATVFTHLKSPRGPLPQLAGEGGAKRRMGCGPLLRAKSDCTIVTANLSSTASCFPHPIRRYAAPSPLRGEGRAPGACRLDDLYECRSLWGRAGEGGRVMRWRSGRSLIAGLNFIGRIRIERANRNGSARPPTLALPHHSPSKDGRSAERPLGGGDAP